ncbi:MAG: HAMP domain-containing sensor histidine kinase [Candidatus Planktophila sp.]|nr:HAMP domain-containing sensor histidine kinase [Candidatus Planktophila sp.]
MGTPIKRFGINSAQIALLIIIGFSMVALTFSTSQISNGASEDNKIFSSIQKKAQSLALLQREGLAFTIKFVQWGAGEVPLIDVIVARAILKKQLSGVEIQHEVARQYFVNQYLANLFIADEIILNSKPGYLSRNDYRAIKTESKIFVDEMLSFSRVFAVEYRAQLDKLLEKSAKDRRQKANINLFLLILTTSLSLIFVSTFIYTLNKQYKAILKSIDAQLILLDTANNNLIQAEILVEKLKLLDVRKSDFISTINHELRTPLTSIIGYVGILRESINTSLNTQSEQILAVIERNSTDLLNLVEEILSLSSLESTSSELVKTRVDVQAIIAECIFALAPQKEASGIAFDVDVEENIETVIDANKNQISQALSNILSNALKFSETNTTVRIRVSEKFDENARRFIRISITDQGMGIPESQIAEIFTSFYRASNVQSSGIPGSGLGLAITSRIIDLHGGSIGVESTEGIGSTFTLDLPAHISELQKMINERKNGVLERAITAIETCANSDLEETCHEMIGALGFYELETLSDEIALFSRWLKTQDGVDTSEVDSRRVELLRALKSKLAALENLKEA